MANYDAHLYALRDLLPDELDALLADVVHILKSHGATIYRKGISPLLTLSRPINDHEKAYQLTVNFSVENASVHDIEAELLALQNVLFVFSVDLDKAHEGRK